MVKIYKKKGTNLKGFQSDNGDILTEAFATDFGNDGITYYVHYTIGGNTNYHMGYANQETGVKITQPIAHMIQGPFVYLRNQYRSDNNRNIVIMDPYTGEVLNSDFADAIIPSCTDYHPAHTPLANSSLVSHLLDKELQDKILLRFVKDKLVGLCDQDGNIVVEAFAEKIDVDGVFKKGDTIGIINLITGRLESVYKGVEIYKPNVKEGQTEYFVKSGNNMSLLENFDYDNGYIQVMLKLLKNSSLY